MNQIAQQSGFHSANTMIEQGRGENARHCQRDFPTSKSNGI
jgi:hypothetical protein